MKILYIAEIVGKAGVYAYKKGLPELKSRFNPDFIIACADGATGGSGLGRNHAAYLHKLGANALTLGECCFFKKDLTENLAKISYVLRPDNLNPEAPGIGSRVFKAGNLKVAVAVLLGQSSFRRIHSSSPFSGLPALLERLRLETPFTFIDFHAQATAEKQTFFAMADGHCSAAIGSHCRVQTGDAKVLPGGTAVITDAGRTGSQNSVGGTEPDSRIQEYLTGIPDWTKEAWAKPELQGVLIDIGDDGKARSIERVQHEVPDAPNSGQEDNPDEDDD
ncbi:TIGR00282 family metallophosphoesterase [Leadbettera azotonutricia]|uniref:Metallophosphoesterase n=1 Tax=Leadbettera azotonutricia (strain ATCC BAA-888 / DSM 13862 / ZAS-9) TaxID=545695 RepID=F5Y950_LEAAZ|nr:TIGR00282 family metallophosphoesterase [Leadbettera azotonutricia]AEF81916.1 metallophosphoesterase [Leadbettera azotonutricia ZAS-9]